jgi:hypothetical protein
VRLLLDEIRNCLRSRPQSLGERLEAIAAVKVERHSACEGYDPQEDQVVHCDGAALSSLGLVVDVGESVQIRTELLPRDQRLHELQDVLAGVLRVLQDLCVGRVEGLGAVHHHLVGDQGQAQHLHPTVLGCKNFRDCEIRKQEVINKNCSMRRVISKSGGAGALRRN